jgi:LDH2 family malate/lactate/ureidoglycolate dehydrogenase
MPAYPGLERDKRVPFDVLLEFVADIFLHCGMRPGDGSLLAGTLAAADVRGVHSHGTIRVPEYVRKLSKGGVDPKGKPRVVSERAAAIVVDGGNSMGQIGAMFAMERTIQRARDLNVAVAAVRGSNHCGALFYYAMKAVEAGMIGIAASNALPTMAPWGGLDKIVGINPLAIAIPAGREHPIVLDAAFSYSSHGKIRVFHQKHEPIPPTWAFDRHGRPTTDPAEALVGLLQPIGEYKGVALAIVMGLLSSMLSGASYGTELGNMESGPAAGQDGHFLAVINLAAFEDPIRFASRVDATIRQIQDSRPATGTHKLYAPGGLEAETEIAYRREGIPRNDETVSGLLQSAGAVGVDQGRLEFICRQ